jgi:3-deoxy-manno-octulosonate cytidylyltransferase (CMP-KDO synthetase)
MVGSDGQRRRMQHPLDLRDIENEAPETPPGFWRFRLPETQANSRSLRDDKQKDLSAIVSNCFRKSARMNKTNSRTLGVIPARLASTRLPRKVLREIAGRPLLAWVVDAARACEQLDSVIVATDADEVAELCRKHDWPCQLTSPDLPSGTDRVHAVAQLHDADIYVNIQGDEPLLRPQHIAALLKPFGHAHVDITTLKVLCTPENVANPNAVKVVTAADGRALYFSRAAIPYRRDLTGPVPQYWKHIGLYAFRRTALNLFPTLPPSSLERAERLEQLRFLENGLSLYVEPTELDTIGVDTEADLLQVEQLLLQRTAAL